MDQQKLWAVRLFSSSLLFAAIFAGEMAYALPACDATVAGRVQYNSPNMIYCNGSAWQVLGGAMGNGTGCHWESWGSKGQGGNNLGNLYTNLVVTKNGSPSSATSGAFCNIGEYVASISGTGVTTGAKRDFGVILCCPVGGG